MPLHQKYPRWVMLSLVGQAVLDAFLQTAPSSLLENTSWVRDSR